MMSVMLSKWSVLWSMLGSFALFWPLLHNHLPVALTHRLATWVNKLITYFSPYHQITISEYGGAERFRRSDFFLNVETYVSDACARLARKLKAEFGRDSKKPQVAVDDHEEVTDTFAGATLWWYASKREQRSGVISIYPGEDEIRYYRVIFHRRHRDLVVDRYLPYVRDEGRAITVRNRQRRLFTNNPSKDWASFRGTKIWSHVPFEHPATFDTLAMDPAQKEAIVDDLTAFRDGKDYYAMVGKPWKRGYLLFGPPGTGKSTMITAMANFLDYDVYDLELTAVKNNTELRRLFIETTGKSIIVVEDIDCSIDLTGKRQKQDKKKNKDDDEAKRKTDDDEGSKVTLSGLLNFIDGLWSACGGERIIIFTTNHKDKLDPALIRRGRMDKHIEMSYCTFQAFKVLAKNYLGVTEEHERFGEIRRLLEETEMTPADVAENLMPMSRNKKRDADACLASLVEALNRSKEDAKKAKEEEEAAKKAKEIIGDDENNGFINGAAGGEGDQ